MRPVADSLRPEIPVTPGAMDATTRLQLALDLGEADARALAAAREIPIEHARRSLQRYRQHGRRRSACHESLLT